MVVVVLWSVREVADGSRMHRSLSPAETPVCLLSWWTRVQDG